MRSNTNLNSFGDVTIVPTQEFLVYKKVKMEVYIKNQFMKLKNIIKGY
ncbi:hypothetical protein [Clostridium botulinum]